MTGLPFVMEYWSESSTEPTRNLSHVPLYLSSIDEALAFAERVLPGFGYALNGGHFKDEATVWLVEAKTFSQQTRFQASAPTLPLAIILATLKAKQAEALPA